MRRCHLWILCVLSVSVGCEGADQEEQTQTKIAPTVERPSGVDLRDATEPTVLSEEEAAQLAAEIANKECSEMFWGTPFSPDDYAAVKTDGRWHWGIHDAAGVSGFSAEVRFDEDGSEPEVEVLLHMDDLN